MKLIATTLNGLVAILNSQSVPYALMGGIAVRAYGVPRPTYDIDATIMIERGLLPQLFAARRDANYVIPEPYEKGWVDDIKGLSLLKLRRYIQDESIDVDLFLAESEFQRSVMARRMREVMDGATYWFASAEDLVLLKLIAGRPRDLGDVTDVLFMQGRLDVEYMQRWAARLNVPSELERSFSEFPDIYGSR